MSFEGWADRSVLEAASWRLGSEIVRRHPDETRLFHGHPGGGQYDVLWVRSPDGNGGDIPMNRNGTIQVHARFDGEPVRDDVIISWDDYLRAEPVEFLQGLESAAGLDAVNKAPSSTARSLTYRLLAAIAATAVKSAHPVAIESGFIDSSGDGGGPNGDHDAFAIPGELLRARDDNLYGEPGYRFWVLRRDRTPLLALESEVGCLWTRHQQDGVHLMTLYNECQRNILQAAVTVLSRADGA